MNCMIPSQTKPTRFLAQSCAESFVIQETYMPIIQSMREPWLAKRRALSAFARARRPGSDMYTLVLDQPMGRLKTMGVVKLISHVV